MSSIQAYLWNRGSLAEMQKEKCNKETPQRLNTDVLQDGRLLRSSDETPVMGAERRGQQLDTMLLGDQLHLQEELLTDYQLKSRMMGDYHVRFCERLGVKFPWPTRFTFVYTVSFKNTYL